MKHAVAIVGVGNLLLSDDGAGIHAIRTPGVKALSSIARLIDGGTVGTDLLAEVWGCEKLLVIDCVDACLRPGTIVELDLNEASGREIKTRNAHQAGIYGLLDDLRLMGRNPREALLIGVQLATTDLGTQLSPEVAGALPSLADAVVRQVRRWTASMAATARQPHREAPPDAAGASAMREISGTEKVGEYI